MKLVRLLFYGACAMALIVAVQLMSRAEFIDNIYHPELEGIRMETGQADDFVKKHAGQIEKHTFGKHEYVEKNGDINPQKWFGVAMNAADDVRDDRRMREAAIARAKDQDVSVLSTEIAVYQDTWATLREIRVPSIVTVIGSVRPENYPNDESGPEGKDWTPGTSRDRTVLMEEQAVDQSSQTTGRLNEALGRLCDDANGRNCRNGMAIGPRSAWCVGPGLANGGFFQGWYNGRQRIGGVWMHLYFSGAEQSAGHFRFVITPDDPGNGRTVAADICKANPGATVIKLPAATQIATNNN